MQSNEPLPTKAAAGPSPAPTDAILAMQDPYMTQIVDGVKNYEFRKYRISHSVQRIWFCRTAPYSSITHICEILPAATRNPGDAPLPEDGLGNVDFNNRDPNWDGYDFAYKIVSVYELREPLSLQAMKGRYGFKAAPRELVYLPESIRASFDWKMQKLVRNPMIHWGLCARLLKFNLHGKQVDTWSEKLNNKNSVSIYLKSDLSI